MNYRYNLTRKFQYLFKIIVKIAINPEMNQKFLILVLSSTIFCTGIIGYLCIPVVGAGFFLYFNYNTIRWC